MQQKSTSFLNEYGILFKSVKLLDGLLCFKYCTFSCAYFSDLHELLSPYFHKQTQFMASKCSKEVSVLSKNRRTDRRYTRSTGQERVISVALFN